MKNILLIIEREYLTRVRKKSFIVMTILGPLLIAAVYGIVIWSVISSVNQKTISILDESGLFQGKFKTSESFTYEYLKTDLETAKSDFKDGKKEVLVYIPATILDNPKGVKIYTEKGVSVEIQMGIERAIEQEIEGIKLAEAGITQSVLRDAKMNIESETINLKEGGEQKSSAGAATAIGFLSAFIIYLAVFIYGAQVMRGVMEEKTSRIVEVIISSVKPFELMIGKIVGVAFVGLTQFLLWIALSFGVFSLGNLVMKDKLEKLTTGVSQSQLQNLPPEAQEMAKQQMQNGMPTGAMGEILGAIDTLPIATIIICFIIYFIGGYLLYSALFGAVGSAVDSETDTQQFMLPITIPIIASFMFAQFVLRDPHGSLAIWTSMIPFTSPIIMMVRIPFGVPFWQLAVSISLLIGGFVFTTWVASRIYRVGILMYGKKTSWKELAKWIFYKG